jgi:hypothetical protein
MFLQSTHMLILLIATHFHPVKSKLLGLIGRSHAGNNVHDTTPFISRLQSLEAAHYRHAAAKTICS